MIHAIWEEFLKIVREEVGSRVVETWFKAVILKQWDPTQKKVYLQTPNTFVQDWIKGNYISLIQTHLARLFNVESVTVIIAHAGKSEHQSAQLQEPPVPILNKRVPSKLVRFRSASRVNRCYTFNTFVMGPSNSLAYAAAQAVAENPGEMYNPLFFYGGPGLGKTHLLHAIGNAIKEQEPSAVILYQTADRFVNEFINAIRFERVHQFQEKYKSVDVLLIDDIQFISNKEQTQEAFFHIFNALYDAHKQIVFSSDTVPQAIHGVAKRLQSRLAGGLVADLQMPTLETKIAILKKKAEANGEILDDVVAQFIASLVTSSVRELEGALIRVMAFSSLTHQHISLDLARKVLLRTRQVQQAPIVFDQIVKTVCKHYSYSLSELRSKNRNKNLSSARQVVMFFLKKMTDKSFRDVGLFLGGRDHSTVMHAYQKIEKKARQYDEFGLKIKKIENDILNSTV